MELFITFKNQPCQNVVDMPFTHAGLNNVRAVRKIEGCEIPLNRCGNYVCGKRAESFSLQLSEDEATRLNLCNKDYEEVMYVEVNELNDLFDIRYVLEKDKETNEIKKVIFEYQIDRVKALEFIAKKLEEEED